MRLMFYINTLAGGGAQRVMSNLANQFVENGDEVIFVTSFPAEGEYPLHEKVDRRNLSEKRIGSALKRNVAYVLGLRKLVKQEKPDILLSFMGEPNYRAILAGLGLSVRTLVSVRNDPNSEYKGAMGRFLGKHIIPLADGCIFQTEQAKLWFPEKLQAKSRIIPNAVKQDFYSIERNPVPGQIVTFGRLEKQKNHKLLIDAFSDIAEAFPHARLLIYGEGKLRGELEAQIAQKNLTEKVMLMGLTSDVPGKLKTADIFVLSSDFEGMPNALMEAMAAGVPSISTDCPCGGPEMLMSQENSGILVRPGDREALADAFRRILSDTVWQESLSRGARSAAEAFLPKQIFAQWKDFFSQYV